MLTEIKDSTACDAIDGEFDYVMDRLLVTARKSFVDFQDINRKLQWSFPGIELVGWSISDEFDFGIHEEFADVL